MSASSSRSLPAWLFSNNAANTAAKANEGAAPKCSKPTTVKMGKKEDKGKLAKQVKKSSRAASPAKKEAAAAQPPRQLLDMVEIFLADNSFDKAHSAFKKQRVQRGLGSCLGNGNGQSLVGLYRTWEASQRTTGKTQAEGSCSESSSESSSSSSDSDSDGEGESEHEAQNAKPPLATLKRKAPASSSSSSSDCSSSDSGSSSGSGTKLPQIKKQRTAAAAESNCGLESDSESSSDGGKMDVDGTSSSSDSEDSSSESGSDSGSSSESGSDSKDAVKAEDAAKVPLPESGSSLESDCSSDDSDSDSADNKPKPGPEPKSVQAAAVKEWSDSSVTLDNKSPERKVLATNPPLPPPDPVTGASKDHKKQQNERFSRIPKNIQVDSKFASNGYVSMDYSQRAYQDLVVTKGKGFTKEKNKKKRGSFRGGMIDIHEKKGVYFDD